MWMEIRVAPDQLVSSRKNRGVDFFGIGQLNFNV